MDNKSRGSLKSFLMKWSADWPWKIEGPELGISGPCTQWRWEGTHRLGCCLN